MPDLIRCALELHNFYIVIEFGMGGTIYFQSPIRNTPVPLREICLLSSLQKCELVPQTQPNR